MGRLGQILALPGAQQVFPKAPFIPLPAPELAQHRSPRPLPGPSGLAGEPKTVCAVVLAVGFWSASYGQALPTPYHVICDPGCVKTLAHSRFTDEAIGAWRGDLPSEPQPRAKSGLIYRRSPESTRLGLLGTRWPSARTRADLLAGERMTLRTGLWSKSLLAL